MSIRWASLLAALLVVAVGFFALARHSRSDLPRGLVRAEVKNVGVASGAPPVGVVVLAPVGSKMVVPLFVTAGEASLLGERETSGSEPAGLPRAALSALGARLVGVVLDGGEEPTARAEIVGRGGTHAVTAPVAEALEWAESAGVPIWLSPGLVAKRGLEQRQLDMLAPGLSPPKRAPLPAESPTL